MGGEIIGAVEFLAGVATDYIIDEITHSSIVGGAGDVTFSSAVNLSGFYNWRSIDNSVTSRSGSLHFDTATLYDAGQSVTLIDYPSNTYIGVNFEKENAFINLIINSTSCYVRVSDGNFMVNGESKTSTTNLSVVASPPTILEKNLTNNALNYPTQSILGEVKGVLGSKYRSKSHGGSTTYPSWVSDYNIYSFPPVEKPIENKDDLNVYLLLFYDDWENIYNQTFEYPEDKIPELPPGIILPDGSYTEEPTETETTTEGGCCGSFDFDYNEVVSPSELDGILNQDTYHLDEIPTDIPDLTMELPSETLSQSILEVLPVAINSSYNYFSALGIAPTLIATAVIVVLIKMLRGS